MVRVILGVFFMHFSMVGVGPVELTSADARTNIFTLMFPLPIVVKNKTLQKQIYLMCVPLEYIVLPQNPKSDDGLAPAL